MCLLETWKESVFPYLFVSISIIILSLKSLKYSSTEHPNENYFSKHLKQTKQNKQQQQQDIQKDRKTYLLSDGKEAEADTT